MSERRRTLAAVLATLLAFAAFDACLGYLMWGIGFGMHDVEWFPLFPLWLVLGAAAAVLAVRMIRTRRKTVIVTVVLCGLGSVAYVMLAWAFGIWACGDGGGCHGPLTRLPV